MTREAAANGGAETRLAVYGTLAPGERNHHVLAGLRGTWTNGVVHGERHPTGWGMTYGHPALVWDPDGPPVPVRVLHSSDLPAHWARLDAFEGDGYRRIVVPVTIGDRSEPANIYVLKSDR
jgi:gamma-glutamylcyclotransferase (GGCT)/AIG2-like uncharacterized protein YtfP